MVIVVTLSWQLCDEQKWIMIKAGRYEKFIIGVGIDHNIPVYYRYGPGNSVNNQRTNRF